MHQLLEHISFDEQPNDDPLTIQVRRKFYYYACIHGHPKCQTEVTAKLLAYVDNPTEHLNSLIAISQYVAIKMMELVLNFYFVPSA